MRIGKITSVNFNQFKVKISSEIRGNSVNYAGTVYYFGNIGSYLKTYNAVGEQLICEVISIFDNDNRAQNHAFDVEGMRELLLKPIGTISQKGIFTLGVGIFPSIYSEVGIVTFDDMKIILHTHDIENDKVHSSFYLGDSKNLINYKVNISINSFFNIHTAILGNSGSGKSNTLAHIIQAIHKKKGHSAVGSRILVFDVNGEYKNAFCGVQKSSEIKIKLYKPNISIVTEDFKPFLMPHFLMNLDEWSAFLLATESTQRPFWDRVLQESYRFYKIGTSNARERETFVNYLRHKVCQLIFSVLNQADTDTSNVTAASSVISSIRSIINNDEAMRTACEESGLENDLISLQHSCKLNYGQNNQNLLKATTDILEKVDVEKYLLALNQRLPHGAFFDFKFLKVAANLALLEEDTRGNKRMREYTATMFARLDYFIENPECNFMRGSPPNVIDERTYLQDFWGTEEDSTKTQMVIIDTSELSPDALETLTSVLTRLIFADRKRLNGEARRKNPVHLLLDEAHRYIKKDYKYILKENIFEKIAREGRKYSIYLMISSQRPSELSETVISQCSNFIIHRVQNEVDMKYVYAVLPYFSDDFANKIKQSVPGEALVFGNCVSMPLHLKIHKADPEPNSKNCNIPSEWFHEGYPNLNNVLLETASD